MRIYHGILCRDVPEELKAYLEENNIEVESKRRDWVLFTDLRQFEATVKAVLDAKNASLVRLK